ncbi:PIN domain-containing protein, partial [Streptomyces sp. NPDC056628]|uniref:PIN domain-containing protein n=1 Tax=Streptomyces sp. NPDC056628 TaxID=3345882 RepID=UPI0036A9E30D
ETAPARSKSRYTPATRRKDLVRQRNPAGVLAGAQFHQATVRDGHTPRVDRTGLRAAMYALRHGQGAEESDFAELLGITEHSVHLLVPMVVVDELDQLKESKAPQARWRARYTLAVLDQLFQKSTEHAVLRQADAEVQRNTGVRRGEVTVQLLFDPPGHVRLPINDDEIVDRALAIKPLSGREVTVTYLRHRPGDPCPCRRPTRRQAEHAGRR